MSDRRPDQRTELFPRRSLSGPSTGQAPTPAAKSGRSSGAATSGGAPTASMPRVDAKAQPKAPNRASGQQGGSTRVGARGGDTGGSATTATSRGDTGEAAGQGMKPAQATPAKATKATKATKAKPAKEPRKAPRKARLRAVRLDPWSVMKMAFALSIALAIVTVVAVFIIWTVLDSAGVWDSINTSVDTVVNSDTSEGFDVRQWVGRGRVMSVALLVSVANVVLLTALATLGAFVYNLAAALLGGFEVTLAEDR
ncbi:hypothetical protein BH20ACT6_BH20ACT6_22630 [soil metagenome]